MLLPRPVLLGGNIMTQNPKYLSIDIGGSSIKYGLLDHAGNLICRGKELTPQSLDPFVQKINDIVGRYLDQIQGVAICAPGKIDPRDGRIYYGGALTFTDKLSLPDELHQKYGDDLIVTVENDCKCAALSELWLGNLRGIDNGVAVVLGTGVGGGLILNGHLYRGTHFQAGELSFMPSFGKTVDVAKNSYGDDGSAVEMVQKIAKHYGFDQNDGIKAFKKIKKDKKFAKKTFNKFCKRIAELIFAIQSVVDVQRYVIGGGISVQPIVTKRIRKYMYQMAEQQGSISYPQIMTAHFHNDANLYGALYNLLLRVNNEI